MRNIVVVLNLPVDEEWSRLRVEMREEMRKAFEGTPVSFRAVICQWKEEKVSNPNTEALGFGL